MLNFLYFCALITILIYLNMKERVKYLLKQKGMSAKDLAQKIGISEGALSLSLSGNPTLSRLQEIADALDIEMAELFSQTGSSLHCPKCGAKLQITELE